MVARAPRPSEHRGRNSLRRFRAAGESWLDHRGRRAGNQLQAGGNSALQRPRRRRLPRAVGRRRRATRLRHSFAQCENCSTALPHQKTRQRLECHYCGYSIRPPKKCPKCNGEFLYFVGDGAERVEEYLKEKFPAARIARLDRDTVRTKREYQQVLGAFANGELDILVGTQMVAKGHDFQRVTLVGVVAADLALGRPDFRAAEKTFQLLTQVAGRAGRGELAGEVLVETHYPEHYAIQHAAKQDYLSFYEKEAHFRRMLHYPPFTALASILVRDKKIENAIRWSRALGEYFAPFEKS